MEGIGNVAHAAADLGYRIIDFRLSAKALVRRVHTNVSRLAFPCPLQRHRSHVMQTRVLRIALLAQLEGLFLGQLTGHISTGVLAAP